MKTPLQELLDWEANLSQMFDSDQRVAMALLEKIRSSRKEMLEKEKEVIMQALNDGKAMAVGNKENQSLEYYYNETFNTKEE